VRCAVCGVWFQVKGVTCRGTGLRFRAWRIGVRDLGSWGVRDQGLGFMA
jgi:hypothetical protein